MTLTRGQLSALMGTFEAACLMGEPIKLMFGMFTQSGMEYARIHDI